MKTSLATTLVLAAGLGVARGATYYVDTNSPHAGDQKSGTFQEPFRTVQKAAETAKPGDTIRIRPDAPSKTWYVDQRHPQASDAGAGTAEAPFLTIQRAADVAQPGDTVKVRPGRYRETVVVHQPGELRQVVDGTWERRRVTFEADGGEVVLDGSWRVPDDAWQPVAGKTNVFVARVERPAFRIRRGWGTSAVPAPAPKAVFAGEKLLLPNVARARGRDKPMRAPEDADAGRWSWDGPTTNLYVNLGGPKPGPQAPVDVAWLFHAFGWKSLHYTTLRGFTIQRYNHGAIYGGGEETWVEDCLFRHNTLAIGGGVGGHVVRCAFLDHPGTAINCGERALYAQNIFVRYYSDPWWSQDYYDSCAIKSFGSDTYFSIRNNVILDEGTADRGYGGCGGIWFDNPSQGNFVYGNTIARAAMGMYIEYPMLNALITWNAISDVNEGIVLRHNMANHVVENYIAGARSRGIKLQDTTRGFVPIVKYNFLAGNYLEDCGIGVVAGPERNADRQEANVADGNIYDLKPGQLAADWAGKAYETVEEFRAGAGMEMHGRADRLAPEALGLVTFRAGDSDRPWKTYAMFGNPHLDRIQFNRSEYGDMHAKTFPGLPYFFEPGLGDGSRRKWFHGDHRADWPRDKAVSIDNHPVGLSWYYTSCEPWTAVVAAPTGGGWVGGGVRGYMKEEAGLSGRGGGDENGCLQVLSRGPEGAPPEGLGWMTVSLPTAAGAVLDLGLWMQAVRVSAVGDHPAGGAVVLVEWSDYTRARVGRSFVVGQDDEGKPHLPKLVTGSFDYSRVEGTVTAPAWAKRFRLFMGLRGATGIVQFDDIDTIRTRPGAAPPDQVEKETPLAPVHAAKLRFEPVDLSKLFNRGLTDEAAGDGKGGWTDEGPQLDMRGIAPGGKLYQNVPYRVGAPLSCIVLQSPARPAGELPEKVGISVPEAQGTNVLMLCFLHGLAARGEQGRTGEAGQEHWRYVVRYGDGSAATIPMVAGRNVRDWTDMTDWLGEPRQWRAFAAESTGGPIHPRQSLWVLEWRNPAPDQVIRSIDFVGSGRGVPVLLGITVGQKR